MVSAFLNDAFSGLFELEAGPVKGHHCSKKIRKGEKRVFNNNKKKKEKRVLHQTVKHSQWNVTPFALWGFVCIVL